MGEQSTRQYTQLFVFSLTVATLLSVFTLFNTSFGYAAASDVPQRDAMSILLQNTTIPENNEEMIQNFLMERQSETILDSFSNATKKKKKSSRKSRTPKDTNPAGSEPVGPDIRGEWSGYIDLIGKERESVSANVYQNGNYIVITTSSHQKYGQKFIGNIKENGFILAYDQKTGEDWTTHSGPATADRIDLYDYVNIAKHGYRDLDRLLLTR